MSFLIDHQLPAALARHLTGLGLDATHISDVGLETADDRTIRRYAASNGQVIVSKDEDFFYLAVADPTGPPLVWVRLGNCRTRDLLASFDRVMPALLTALRSGQNIVELR